MSNLDLNYYCRVYDNFLDADLCDFYVNEFERLLVDEAEKIEKYKICKAATRPDGTTYCGACNCQRLDPMQHEVFNETNKQILFEKIPLLHDRYKEDYNLHAAQFPKSYSVEALRMKRVLREDGSSTAQQFTEHVDVSSWAKGKRFLAILIYLNDDFGGGETVFPTFGDSIKPKKGSVLVFPPYWCYLHAGRPLTDYGYAKYYMLSFLNYNDTFNDVTAMSTNISVDNYLKAFNDGAIKSK